MSHGIHVSWELSSKIIAYCLFIIELMLNGWLCTRQKTEFFSPSYSNLQTKLLVIIGIFRGKKTSEDILREGDQGEGEREKLIQP